MAGLDAQRAIRAVPVRLAGVHPMLASMMYVVARRLARHQGRSQADARRVPLWRLLVDEIVYLVGRALRRDALLVWVPTVVVVAGIMVGLAEATPGPVLDLGWRLLLAAGAGVAVGAAARRVSLVIASPMSDSRGSVGTAYDALRGILVVVAFAAVLVALGAALALLVSVAF